MSFDFVDLSSDDDEAREANVKGVKLEKNLVPSTIPRKEQIKAEKIQPQKFESHRTGQEGEQNGRSDANQSSPCMLDQGSYPANGTTSSLPLAPLCRQFWKAGTYTDGRASQAPIQRTFQLVDLNEEVNKITLLGLAFCVLFMNALLNLVKKSVTLSVHMMVCVDSPGGQNHLRVHPKFLHSNATSHKWAFGAIAELLDNAFDEIQNGATFVMVDKISNPHDRKPALLFQDDGGGMDPESMRRCMSFGFSDKKSNLSIGQYGNGFKTSTMRLGADVVVFSRHNDKRALTQSVGLLSYTFLRQTGHDRIVVPMVDFQFNKSTGKFGSLIRYSEEHFSSNLSMLLEWSPYKTKAELMKQFDNIGQHGTKVIIYNLWFNDDGDMELDFESDAEDILLHGAPKAIQSKNNQKMLNQQHIANRFHYSLRVYLSILYLRVPEHFRIILRGQVVQHHNIADDIKFPEFILYKPQVGANVEAMVITTIGFLKEAPHVNIHGFSVYHKNRLIMPFWRVVNQANSRGRGVVGILEANFVEPTHNKQEFEKTTLFQKLESRLKEMTLEYWDLHCGLVGYHQVKKPSTAKFPSLSSGQQSGKMSHSPTTIDSQRVASVGGTLQDHVLYPSPFSGGRPTESIANRQPSSHPGFSMKRKENGHIIELEVAKRRASSVENVTDSMQHLDKKPANGYETRLQEQEASTLMQENRRLHEQCLVYEKSEEELNLKMEQLRNELVEVEREYRKLLTESKLMDELKEEKM